MKQQLSHIPGPIGVFDSGYGGLTILEKIREVAVAQFLTAFYKDHKLTKEEIEELRKSIDELDQ